MSLRDVLHSLHLTHDEVDVSGITSDLLQQYQDAGRGKFDYTIIEPKTEDERKKAEEAGLQKLQRIEGSDTEDAMSYHSPRLLGRWIACSWQ